MSTEEKQRPQTSLDVIRKEFQSPQVMNLFMDAMPKAAGKQAEDAAKRFTKMVYTAISQSQDLQKCTVKSLIRAASISASLDLDIDPRGLAYLVPYKGEANFQIGYLGLIELAYRSGKVKAISAHCIYESEKDTVKIVRKDGQYTVEHPFSYDKPKGKVIAVYATAIVEGIDPQTIVLRMDEIEFYHNKSKCPNSPAWKEFPEAMMKKTAIRQLAKYLPKSIVEEFTQGAAIDEKEDFVTAQNSAQKTITEQAGSEIVDISFDNNQPPAEQAEVAKPLDEPDPETKAKTAEQKQKLTEAETSKKKATTKKTTKKPEFLYECNACGHLFDDPKISGTGSTIVSICPNCLSKNIKCNEESA